MLPYIAYMDPMGNSMGGHCILSTRWVPFLRTNLNGNLPVRS
jgi:hypothetical protein